MNMLLDKLFVYLISIILERENRNFLVVYIYNELFIFIVYLICIGIISG